MIRTYLLKVILGTGIGIISGAAGGSLAGMYTVVVYFGVGRVFDGVPFGIMLGAIFGVVGGFLGALVGASFSTFKALLISSVIGGAITGGIFTLITGFGSAY